MHETAKKCAENLVARYGTVRALIEAKNLAKIYAGQGRGYWDEYYEEVINTIKSMDEKIDQYPSGTDVLWMAHYRTTPESGDMDGMAVKLSGTLEEVAVQAQEIAVKENAILQCLRRRYQIPIKHLFHGA